jgi:hypothetical protein
VINTDQAIVDRLRAVAGDREGWDWVNASVAVLLAAANRIEELAPADPDAVLVGRRGVFKVPPASR